MPPRDFLTINYLMCCPHGSDAASRFCVLAFQYLLDTPWRDKYTVELFGQTSVRLPRVLGPHGLPFLQILREQYLGSFVPQSSAMQRIYARLARQLHQASAPSSTFKPEVQTAAGGSIDRDANVRLLIHDLWNCTQSCIKRDSASLFGQNNRRRASSQMSDGSMLLMRMASDGLSDQALVHCLRSIWDALDTNPSRAPQHLGNLIYACVKNQSRVPMALNLLEIIPQSVLRDWIAAMSATGGEKHRVPQLGQRGPLYLNMWFRLLYQLDARTNAILDEQASLCQFAFHRFVRAHFDHDYPPFTLVIALLYGLLGHKSFATKASVHLSEYIESSSLFSAEKDYTDISLDGLLAELMDDLARESLPNHGVLELLIPYIDEYKGFRRVSNTLEQISKHKIKISDTAFLTRYTAGVLEEISKKPEFTGLGHGLASFHRLVTSQATLNPAATKLQARLEDTQARRSFSHILARANEAHIVPLAYRDLNPDLPEQVQTDLIHQFAYQYALDRTRSVEQNWRSLRYLYLYLRIHNLPIQPLFTKTIVSACITRPLAENRFVAQKKAVWVCKLVARVEGEAAARQVEHLFWAWRGDLILRAKSELMRLGVHDVARVGVVERLKVLDKRPEEWHRNAADYDL